MKITVICQIETGGAQEVKAEAFSNETANIYICAADPGDVAALMQQGEQLAKDAMRNWKPKEQPVEEKAAGYCVTSSLSIEEMNKAAAAYEESRSGQRFIKELESAAKFELKHSKGILSLQKLIYLANKYHNNLLNGSHDLIALSYRKGYKDAQKAVKVGRE